MYLYAVKRATAGGGHEANKARQTEELKLSNLLVRSFVSKETAGKIKS